jgi:hypothetical protein
VAAEVAAAAAAVSVVVAAALALAAAAAAADVAVVCEVRHETAIAMGSYACAQLAEE